MNTIVKSALAVVAGIFSGGATLAILEMGGHKVAEGEMLFVVAALILGVAAFVGGIVARLIAPSPWVHWAIAAALGALSLVNVFSFPHPIWFVPVAFVLLALGAFGAAKVRP